MMMDEQALKNQALSAAIDMDNQLQMMDSSSPQQLTHAFQNPYNMCPVNANNQNGTYAHDLSDSCGSDNSSDGDFNSPYNGAAEFDNAFHSQFTYPNNNSPELSLMNPVTPVATEHYDANCNYVNYPVYGDVERCRGETDNIHVYTTDNSGEYYNDDDSVELPLNTFTNMLKTTPYPSQTADYSLPHFGSIFDKKSSPTKRGRPVTFNKPGHQYRDMNRTISSDDDDRLSTTQRCKRGAKNILLWKFLLEELRKSQGHIKWENEMDGTFKFVDTTECSRRWGQMKKKEDMNFEKLSRGIRHYYKDGLMSRMEVRLVYKFNWKFVPSAYWPRVH